MSKANTLLKPSETQINSRRPDLTALRAFRLAKYSEGQFEQSKMVAEPERKLLHWDSGMMLLTSVMLITADAMNHVRAGTGDADQIIEAIKTIADIESTVEKMKTDYDLLTHLEAHKPKSEGDE